MIVLITPEQDMPNEIEILNRLFDAGLAYYHLRKPGKNYRYYCDYLNQIDSKHHDKVVVHFFHELLNDFNLKGIHFQEVKRQRANFETLESIRNNYNISISSSFHSPEELNSCKFTFNYHLLSPVFSSISKQGYQGQRFDVNHINKTVIGMGGVTTTNLNEFDKLGYHGVGVLGGIWYSETPVEDFKIILNHFDKKQ